jgi:hypothetical protein
MLPRFRNNKAEKTNLNSSFVVIVTALHSYEGRERGKSACSLSNKPKGQQKVEEETSKGRGCYETAKNPKSEVFEPRYRVFHSIHKLQ